MAVTTVGRMVDQLVVRTVAKKDMMMVALRVDCLAGSLEYRSAFQMAVYLVWSSAEMWDPRMADYLDGTLVARLAPRLVDCLAASTAASLVYPSVASWAETLGFEKGAMTVDWTVDWTVDY